LGTWADSDLCNALSARPDSGIYHLLFLAMAAPVSPVLAALALRCPHCHEGRLFTHSAFNLAHFTDMPERCEVCAVPLEPEPGFYWGAMFISYGFNVATVLIIGALLYFLGGDPDVWVYVLTVTVFALVLAPSALRYSRTLMLYWFGGARYRYKPAKLATGTH
jgi:uncharacterized protein (DUF983 family)